MAEMSLRMKGRNNPGDVKEQMAEKTQEMERDWMAEVTLF
jgi:hypothetical protein